MQQTIFFLFSIIITSSSLFADFTWTEVGVPVRDGATLAADLYSIDTSVAKPVILIQTPYNKNLYRITTQLPPQAGSSLPLDTASFNYIILDWRGFFGSRNSAKLGYDRGLDGYDAVEWIAEQRWCNGKVATWGPSALGAIQFQTARHHPPHLVCAVPMVKDFKTQYTNYYYGGEFRKSHVNALQRLGFFTTNLILDHPTNDLFMRAIETNTDTPEEFAVPMLMIGGWFDHYPDDVLRAFHDIVERSDPSVRDQHKLIFGPWTHSGIDKSEQGELEYPHATISNVATLQFFHHYLLNADNLWPTKPHIQYYQLGANEWKASDNWFTQVEETETTSLYLRSQERLSSTDIGGPDFPPVTFRYDPHDPSPTHGGSFFDPFNRDAAVGPFDQREVVESRDDRLIFSTPPLEKDVEVTGPVSVELFISSDREDTDIAVRLCDVYPDGRSMIMTQGIRRMRFREGFRPQDTSLLTPGEVYKVIVELQHLGITFKAGHQIRIIITGSNYPHFDVNPNTAEPLYESTDSVIATTSIYLAPEYPSRVILPTPRTSSVTEDQDKNKTSLTLSCSPNLIQDVISVSFSLSKHSEVQFDLINTTGQQVRTLRSKMLDEGNHTLKLDLPADISSGMYFLSARTEGKTTSVPVLIMP